ncbi:hypothetical protein BURK1_00780 [Burkholderiales bacterium]|nr:hypothetical protein BURK1_00780 [Burkholderiales bacterium]
MRRLRATVGWRLPGRGGAWLDARVVELVALAARHGSLASAARAAGLPYRTAWALVDGAERALGQRLLLLERGVGARPARLGRRLLAARVEAERLLEGGRSSVDVALGRASAAREHAPLRIAASHDLVLAQLRDAWARRHGIAIAFHGSAEAIDRYLAGRADVAGFHVAEPGSDSDIGLPDPLLGRLDVARDAVIPFVVRTQGLILPRGNPGRVRSIADIASRRLRFVNRQPGSGTRLALERWLAREHVVPGAIVGWTHEEFTHAAVAATVAAGEADAGFGIQAAATQLGLAFVPVVDERYAFACRRAELTDPRIRAFLALVASETVAKVVAPLPGYRWIGRRGAAKM